MAYDVLDFTKNLNSAKEYVDNIRQGVPLALFGVTDPFKYYLASRTGSPVIYVVDDRFKAYNVAREISEFLGKEVNVLPPKDELLFKAKGFLKDGLYQRICATERLIDGEFTITTAEALMQTFSARIEKIEFAVGKTYDYSNVAPTLIRLGYKMMETAEEKGTFAIRGDILDIYPTDKDNPFRIDFFGDDIENIREIDGESGKSGEFERLFHVRISPDDCVEVQSVYLIKQYIIIRQSNHVIFPKISKKSGKKRRKISPARFRID